MEKIGRNRENDKKTATLLKKAGWKILVVWECELKPAKDILKLNRLIKKIQGNR
jgi:DNA mismatch endonuclease (patch repair protein)